MADFIQTLELTNTVHMPLLGILTGDEMYPIANNGSDRVPMSVLTSTIGDYVLGKYVFNLTNYPPGQVDSLSTLMLVDNGQTYIISIEELSSAITPNFILDSSGLAVVTDIVPGHKKVDVMKATVAETDAAIRNDVAVTPFSLQNYKSKLATLEAQIEDLMYKPMAITSFSASPNVSEIGSTVQSVTLNWVLNKAPSVTSVSNYTGPSILPNITSLIINGPFSSDRSWTLTVNDGTGKPGSGATSSTSLSFRNKRYWGVSPNTSLTNSEILGLQSEFSTSKTKDVTYNASGGQYVYYVYPTSFGTLNAVSVGGLAFSDYTVTSISLTNASGHTSQYNVVRINNIQTGANIQVHWA